MELDSKLAISGGEKTRTTPMPLRQAFGEEERKKISEVFSYYDSLGIDPGYEGHFENCYCELFSNYMGGGFADAVSTGSASLFIALLALDLPKGSSILVSPITDPGTISAITLAGYRPKLLDTAVNSYNVSLESVKSRLSPDVSCLMLVHAAGVAAPINEISNFLKSKNIPIIEDCSQAHGAEISGHKVGTFGDISCFSTMYRKASMTGSSGGVVFTKNELLFQKIVVHADRGKPRWKKDFDDRNPNHYLLPALNFNTDEISCAIGIASLSRLEITRKKRISFLQKLSSKLKSESAVCRPYGISDCDSPFYYPIFIDLEKIKVSKVEFAKAVLEEGIPLSPHYNYLVKDWPWIKEYLVDNFDPVNARNLLASSFNIYLNENYGESEVNDIVRAILKVENYFRK